MNKILKFLSIYIASFAVFTLWTWYKLKSNYSVFTVSYNLFGETWGGIIGFILTLVGFYLFSTIYSVILGYIYKPRPVLKIIQEAWTNKVERDRDFWLFYFLPGLLGAGTIMVIYFTLIY